MRALCMKVNLICRWTALCRRYLQRPKHNAEAMFVASRNLGDALTVLYTGTAEFLLESCT